VYIPRGITGRKAEEIFIRWYREKNDYLPIGELKDFRDYGCGYDFEIITNQGNYKIEIKGILLDEPSGIMFTEKEWITANLLGDNYFLVIVTNLDVSPIIRIFQNPAKLLLPKKNILTTIQVVWNIRSNDLNNTDSEVTFPFT
jgi:hypothetical protein